MDAGNALALVDGAEAPGANGSGGQDREEHGRELGEGWQALGSAPRGHRMKAKISSRQGLASLPEQLPWEQFSYAIVESAAEVRWLELPRQKADAAGYPRGLAFGELAELRWVLRAYGGYHVVLISDSGDVALPGSGDEADLVPGDDGQII